jgi:hypothetical protein
MRPKRECTRYRDTAEEGVHQQFSLKLTMLAYTLMLKSELRTEAAIILKRLDNGQALSDLTQELFEK